MFDQIVECDKVKAETPVGLPWPSTPASSAAATAAHLEFFTGGAAACPVHSHVRAVICATPICLSSFSACPALPVRLEAIAQPFVGTLLWPDQSESWVKIQDPGHRLFFPTSHKSWRRVGRRAGRPPLAPEGKRRAAVAAVWRKCVCPIPILTLTLLNTHVGSLNTQTNYISLLHTLTNPSLNPHSYLFHSHKYLILTAINIHMSYFSSFIRCNSVFSV